MLNPLNSTYLGRTLVRGHVSRVFIGWVLLNPWVFLLGRLQPPPEAR